jgi:predicted metal-dependent phosphoesterase TrpH
VHVLALGFEAEPAPTLLPTGRARRPSATALQAAEVRRRIHGAGGLALLAHPARYRLPFARLIEAAVALGFDGAEALLRLRHATALAPDAPWCATRSPPSLQRPWPSAKLRHRHPWS